jgi:transcriptional regulator with XRE-family HTH domain
LTDGIAFIRAIRIHRQLSLRDVEEQSLRLAQECGNEAYRISAGWLDRLEREEDEMSLSTIVALANIYNIPAEQLLRSVYLGGPQAVSLGDPSVPNATGRNRTPNRTTILPGENATLPEQFWHGVIGKYDRTLDPMVPPGSLVYLDTKRRAIPTRTNWTHGFQRPIYFLLTWNSYVCGWCELDEASEWLTLIPHPLSPVSIRRWKYPAEIENIGRVVVVTVPSAERG